ncbi:hypothetical protein [Brevibacillus invocatus]|uniref:hypothetical protein n=1 Tax=Brevibacillus invocatus TaxID=173959 RepID=UPI00203CEAE3|nr:hypothetical protein [Brevibacillus invocatus]MCM3078611.1 hypothetical protein [Brevibacillus invocatus]MCM3429140.1 hypothetical protein [Brevibacillus invocatus]
MKEWLYSIVFALLLGIGAYGGYLLGVSNAAVTMDKKLAIRQHTEMTMLGQIEQLQKQIENLHEAQSTRNHGDNQVMQDYDYLVKMFNSTDDKGAGHDFEQPRSHMESYGFQLDDTNWLRFS